MKRLKRVFGSVPSLKSSKGDKISKQSKPKATSTSALPSSSSRQSFSESIRSSNAR